jgi:hypothetical protein
MGSYANANLFDKLEAQKYNFDNMAKEEIIGNAIKVYAGLGMPPKGQPMESTLLSEPQIQQVAVDLGHDLAMLHSKEGQGYGWLLHNISDMPSIINTAMIPFRGFRAPNSNWYEFLTGFFDQQDHIMNRIREQEQTTGPVTILSPEHREQMEDLWEKRPLARRLFEQRRSLLEGVQPNLLHGNIHPGSIYVDQGRYAGLGDFRAILLGDPVDDLAYFSLMPQGERLAPFVKQGWEEVKGSQDIAEKFHLYRLWESYRKIYTRYTKHHYLEDYPEPLTFAQQELAYFNAQ